MILVIDQAHGNSQQGTQLETRPETQQGTRLEGRDQLVLTG